MGEAYHNASCAPGSRLTPPQACQLNTQLRQWAPDADNGALAAERHRSFLPRLMLLTAFLHTGRENHDLSLAHNRIAGAAATLNA